MRIWILVLLFSAMKVFAQSNAASVLTLESYLNQVKEQNPEARSIQEQVSRAELRLDEAEIPLSSEFYTSYNWFDDKNEPTSSFMGNRVQQSGYRVGVRDQTRFGLSTDVFFLNQHSKLYGVNTAFGILDDYYDTKAGVELKQSLWRNGFGETTRATMSMQRSLSRMELLKRQLEMKNLLLKSENAYWTLVSLNQIVKLQEENVARAKTLRDWMAKRVNMRLVDDVEGLQARAAYEMRDLELQTSLDERATVAREFNTLRGVASDEVEKLAELPPADILLKTSRDQKQRMSREDFKILYEQAEASLQETRGAQSQIAPQLDLTASIHTNGLDRQESRSQEEIRNLQHPTWAVGVIFSVPLDYSLIGNMRKSYKAAKRASESAKQHATFTEERAWHDLNSQKTEAQRRFERALSLEKVQTDLVKRERQRLMNGRTTTFQAITFEQNLAEAQVQKLRSQLALLQIHNVLKTWEGQP